MMPPKHLPELIAGKRAEIHSLQGQVEYLKRKKKALPKGRAGSIYEASKREEARKKLEKELEDAETALRRRRTELTELEKQDAERRQLPLF